MDYETGFLQSLLADRQKAAAATRATGPEAAASKTMIAHLSKTAADLQTIYRCEIRRRVVVTQELRDMQDEIADILDDLTTTEAQEPPSDDDLEGPEDRGLEDASGPDGAATIDRLRRNIKRWRSIVHVVKEESEKVCDKLRNHEAWESLHENMRRGYSEPRVPKPSPLEAALKRPSSGPETA